MALKLFNTLSRSVESFTPLDPADKFVGLYCCGPTIHDFAHIGNFRTFVFSDLVRRYLEFRGYSVRHVMNITDVEDKIIQRVQAHDSTLKDYTAKYEAAFFEDLQTLGCLKPTFTPHATDHIADIISLISKLMERGIAYRTPDGSVYFSIEKYRSAGHTYGQLLKLNFDAMRPGERVASDEYEKESVADFALWKSRVPGDGAVFWPSPWGEGRPGWHIECSAMSMNLLGPSFDLHLGGEDLIFPHHEDEIAQSEGACDHSSGSKFVRYWLHCAHLLVEGRKMSKSLGNFFTIRDLVAKGFTGREIRFLLLSSHYRESFNFTLDGLAGERTALGRLDGCLARLREIAERANSVQDNIYDAVQEVANIQIIKATQSDPGLVQRFTEAMDEDFNVSAARAAVFTWLSEQNRLLSENKVNRECAAAALEEWDKVDAVLGIGPSIVSMIPPEIDTLAGMRQVARQMRDFKLSDAIRDELKAKGWVIEDTPKGPRLKRAG